MPISKRSRFIDLAAMRKSAKVSSLVITSGLMASGCSEEAQWYPTVEACIDDTGCTQFCRTAYQSAKEEAQRGAPRYRNRTDCEAEFGERHCVEQGLYYQPEMAGFLVREADECDLSDVYHGRSLFLPVGRFSPHRNTLFTASGSKIGSAYKKRFSVGSSTFGRRATVSKPISRGGFGKTVRKHSFSSRSSWGG